jgi:glycosyltransferase involved in cell wall biosynthesis
MPDGTMQLSPYRYWGMITTRNRLNALQATLRSLKEQSVPPRIILVLDDGSTPPVTLANEPDVTIIRRESGRYDDRRLVQNQNMCLALALSNGIVVDTDFVLVTADDCTYPSNYAETIMRRMKDENMVVASGSRGLRSPPGGSRPPEGSGRIISHAFLRTFGFQIPERTGHETWIVFEALRRGNRVACYTDVKYTHLERFGGKHGFAEWGHMAYVLGYDPMFFIARCGWDMVSGTMPIKPCINAIANYVRDRLIKPSSDFYKPFDKDFRNFVARTQRIRFGTLVQEILGRRLRYKASRLK